MIRVVLGLPTSDSYVFFSQISAFASLVQNPTGLYVRKVTFVRSPSCSFVDDLLNKIMLITITKIWSTW